MVDTQSDYFEMVELRYWIISLSGSNPDFATKSMEKDAFSRIADIAGQPEKLAALKNKKMKGIEFTLKDGSKDSYDPIDIDNDFSETDTHYILDMVFTYTIEKTTIESYREYVICSECGYEKYDLGCLNFHCIIGNIHDTEPTALI